MTGERMDPTQETPGGGTIPVPKRQDVLRDLRKVAKSKPPVDDDSAASRAEEE